MLNHHNGDFVHLPTLFFFLTNQNQTLINPRKVKKKGKEKEKETLLLIYIYKVNQY